MYRRLTLILTTALFAVLGSVPVIAGTGNAEFDYSAEKMPCMILPSAVDTEAAERNRTLLGEVTDLDWTIGPKEAVLTIIEYADFQCPYCAAASLSLLDYQKQHNDEVRLVYRHFPLSFHEKAVTAALAADAAGYQGLFFEAEEMLFERQNEWTVLADNEAFSEWLIEEFSHIPGLDFELWYLAFTDSDNEFAVRNRYSQVISTGIVNGTPTVFLNYADSNYMFDSASMDAFIEKLKNEKNRIFECPDVVIKQDIDYSAVLETEIGDIHIDLYPDMAPYSVNNFVYLINNGLYNGSRISKNQNGIFDVIKDHGAVVGYTFASENIYSGKNEGSGYAGMVGMINGETDSGLFITGDINDFYKEKIQHEISGRLVSDEAIDLYADLKSERFMRENTVFGRVVQSDMDKLERLRDGTEIRQIRIIQSE